MPKLTTILPLKLPSFLKAHGYLPLSNDPQRGYRRAVSVKEVPWTKACSSLLPIDLKLFSIRFQRLKLASDKISTLTQIKCRVGPWQSTTNLIIKFLSELCTNRHLLKKNCITKISGCGQHGFKGQFPEELIKKLSVASVVLWALETSLAVSWEELCYALKQSLKSRP